MTYAHDTAATAQSSQTRVMADGGENILHVAESAEKNSGNAVIVARKRKLRLRMIENRVRFLAVLMAAIGLFAQDEMVFVPALIASLMAFTVALIIGYRTKSSNVEAQRRPDRDVRWSELLCRSICKNLLSVPFQIFCMLGFEVHLGVRGNPKCFANIG